MAFKRMAPVILASILLAIGSGDIAAAAPAAQPAVELVARFDHQVTGVTASADGRVFVSFPRWSEDAPVSVAELLKDGTTRTYPDADWNAWRRDATENSDPAGSFVCVQSVIADGRGNLWVLDPGAPEMGDIVPGAPKLVRIDLASNAVAQVIALGAATKSGSYFNDVRFSPDGRHAYITDSGKTGALIAVDLDSGAAWRMLDGHPATQAESDVTVTSDGAPLQAPNGQGLIGNADGIALSADGTTLYWQALTGKTLYAIPTDQLGQDITEDQRVAAMERVATTNFADGLLMGADGTLYVTSPGDHSIKRVEGDGTATVVTDPRWRWPDTLAQDPDGTIYMTDSHIPDSLPFDPDASPAVPTQLYSFQP